MKAKAEKMNSLSQETNKNLNKFKKTLYFTKTKSRFYRKMKPYLFQISFLFCLVKKNQKTRPQKKCFLLFKPFILTGVMHT